MRYPRSSLFLVALFVLGWPKFAIPSQKTNSYLELDGQTLKVKTDEDRQQGMTYAVNFPSAGIWYVWIRATSLDSKAPSLLRFVLDNDSPQSSRERSEILIDPNARSSWFGFTRFPDFRSQFYIADSGDHQFSLFLIKGNLTIEKIILTYAYSATPTADKLDVSSDPGEGVIRFSNSDVSSDGFQEAKKSVPPAGSGKTYYVDSVFGDDADTGTSSQKAWKTFFNVNRREFQPGDSILLRRGRRWEEGLAPKGSGSPTKWINIAAYDHGRRPIIDGLQTAAIRLLNQSYWNIQDLEVTNFPEFGHSGISILSDETVRQPKGIKISNCIAHDTGGIGILVGSSEFVGGVGKANGFDQVTIENCLSYFNSKAGIRINGNDQDGCRNSIIRYCTTFGNGDAGIWIKNGQNGLVENCISFSNVKAGFSSWFSINMTFRNCESYRSLGSGFYIDTSKGSVIERCFSHENEEGGFVVLGSQNPPKMEEATNNRFDIVRYCVSRNDNPGIHVSEYLQQGKIYNNLVETSGSGRYSLLIDGYPPDNISSPEKRLWGGGWPSETEIANNIFISKHGSIPAWVDHLATSQNNIFDYNLYWRDKKELPLIRWGGNVNGLHFWDWNIPNSPVPPSDYYSLESFRRVSKQENHGIEEFPLFQQGDDSAFGRSNQSAFQIKTWSPGVGAGRREILSKEWLKARMTDFTNTSAERMGIPMDLSSGETDFTGRKIEISKGVSMGATEP